VLAAFVGCAVAQATFKKHTSEYVFVNPKLLRELMASGQGRIFAHE